MKNILILITILSINLMSSQIYPLNTSSSHVPDNAYIKDTNNELDKYVGLWMGNWNGKTLYLELKKYKRFNSGSHPYYIDEIVGERKIINSSGIVEIDRITNFDNEDPEFFGIYNSLDQANWKRILFMPDNMCRKTANLDITSFTGTTMTLHFTYEPSFVDPNCIHNAYVNQYGDYPMNFPKDIVLTKQ